MDQTALETSCLIRELPRVDLRFRLMIGDLIRVRNGADGAVPDPEAERPVPGSKAVLGLAKIVAPGFWDRL
jgi:hypothetical protein